MVKGTYVALGVLAAIALLALGTVGAGVAAYNNLNAQSVAVDAQAKNVDVIYQRNFALIPVLQNLTEKYMQNEKDIQTQVAALRSGLPTATTGNLSVRDNYTQQFANLVALVGNRAEAYPNLKADQLFVNLQDEVTNSQNKIAAEKLRYNDKAQEYNTLRNTCCFPILVSHMAGFGPKEYIGYSNRPNQVDFPSGQTI